jgi:hypothetical protein
MDVKLKFLAISTAHRMRVFENWVLKGIAGPEGEEVIGDWRTLHNGELHDLYCSLDIIKTIKLRIHTHEHMSNSRRNMGCPRKDGQTNSHEQDCNDLHTDTLGDDMKQNLLLGIFEDVCRNAYKIFI